MFSAVNPVSLIVFSLFWLIIVYLLNCLIAKEWKKIDPKLALLYFTTVAMIGVFGEIFLDTVYNFFVGQPLWYYNILPVHGGYTSAFAPIVWGIYGFHLYLLHDSLHSKWSIIRTRHLALIICFEALVLEALLTLSAKPILGDLMYYYLPGDLWHVTSIQNIPFYFICGVLIVRTMRHFKTAPRFFIFLNVFLISTLVYFA